MKLIKKNWIVLLLITFFAFGQRFYNIEASPPSLNWDEVSHGYNAYSILKTGADEWGVKFPLIFKAFGDYKLPVYIYLTAIPVYFLGLTSTAVRLISVIAGTLAVPGIYLLTNLLFSKGQTQVSPVGGRNAMKVSPGVTGVLIGHFAALLLAISPWHFFISRPALEANLALTFIIFGFWALIKAGTSSTLGRDSNPKFYLLSSILLGLSLHTYNVARVFVPLLLLVYFFIYRPKFKFNLIHMVSLSILALSIFAVVYQIFSGTGTARYAKLSILSDSAVYQLGQDRSNSSLPPLLAKLRYNRPLYFVTKVLNYYVSYFSPKFIYQSQGAQYQFAIPYKNLFTLPVTILSLIGGIYLILKQRSQSTYLLYFWLFLSPLAAALTADPPQALRPNPMIPVIIIFSSIGVFLVVDLFKKRRWAQKAVLISIILSCLLGYIRYLDSYHSTYPQTYSWSWQYGYQQAIEYVEKNKNNYDRVIFTKYFGEPHIFYAFYSKLDPKDLQPGGDNIRFQQTNWFWTDRIGSVYFVNDWQIPKVLADSMPLESGTEVSFNNSLLVVSPKSLPSNVTILKTINFLDGTPAFIIATPK